jgi:Uma2 family endonuclease
MAAVTNSAEGKVILEGVSWETYERLLSENQEKGTRFAYDQGALEIIVVSFGHDNLSRKIALLVELIAAEMEIDIEVAGSTTFKREDLFKGFEPDESFYIREPERVRGKREIDLRKDPPPDLVIEVDITNPSLNKMTIFSAIGIAELWRYSKGHLSLLKLTEAGYIEISTSSLLPGVSSSVLNRFIERGRRLKRNVWIREIREWARKARPAES